MKIGIWFALRSRRRESLRVSVWVWERESDFAMIGMMFVRVARWRMMVMSTGFNPEVRAIVGGHTMQDDVDHQVDAVDSVGEEGEEIGGSIGSGIK